MHVLVYVYVSENVHVCVFIAYSHNGSNPIKKNSQAKKITEKTQTYKSNILSELV